MAGVICMDAVGMAVVSALVDGGPRRRADVETGCVTRSGGGGLTGEEDREQGTPNRDRNGKTGGGSEGSRHTVYGGAETSTS